MKVDEFQRKYQDYSIENYIEALSDAIKVNAVLVGGTCSAVKIGDKYCLMLDKSSTFLKDIGVL
jgi:hypothetical protein